jgi:hypothetical protein
VRENLPALLVVVPLILAPVAALVGRWRAVWAVAAADCWWALNAALSLLQRVRD